MEGREAEMQVMWFGAHRVVCCLMGVRGSFQSLIFTDISSLFQHRFISDPAQEHA